MDNNKSDSIKEKALSISRQIAVPAIAAALASAATYFVCDSIYSDKEAALQDQISELQKVSKEAMVTQRISEQMEDIAFQQKTISDKQREAAESQKKIADIERGKAEIERGLAQAAERKAVASAKEAEQMRILADEQKEEAVHNMQAAEYARAQTDTLFYQSLGASLAQAAQAQGTKKTNTKRLLAYASWYYTTAYGGNLYNQDIYKALTNSSGELQALNMAQGSVRAFLPMTNNGEPCAIAISDFGGILFMGTGKNNIGFSLPGIPFRDACLIDDNRFVAVASNGSVLKFHLDNTTKDHTPINERYVNMAKCIWQKIVDPKDGKTLLLLSSDKVAWIDRNTLIQLSETKLDGEPTVMGLEGNTVHIFGKDNTHYVVKEQGVVESKPLKGIDSRVTAYHYAEEYGYHILGTESGKIVYLDADGNILYTLTGHSGPITALESTGKHLLSASYDKKMRYWDLANPESPLTNISISFDDWPLCIAVNKEVQQIWVGCGSGEISSYNLDPNINASYVQKGITEDFTKPDWDRYIGAKIPFRSFMPAKEGGEK